MKNKSVTLVVFLQLATILGIVANSYFTFLNKARIQATQRVMVETQNRLSSTIALMDEAAEKKAARKESLKPLEVGMRAPAFTLKDENEEEVSLYDFKGKKTLLVFSNENCSYCKKFYPVLNDFRE